MNKFWTISFVLLGIFTSSMALSCLPCYERECEPLPAHCPAGIGKDICYCCPVCAQAENEECGGPWDMLGRCGDGLTCVKEEDDYIDEFNRGGICKKV
uniref:Putative venom protein n=1 Tax=Superstitionia donensis TaxID=311983 RepID=A0A1V1WBG2_9SCOR